MAISAVLDLINKNNFEVFDVKEFLKALLYTVLIQILIWGIYIYFNELAGYIGSNELKLLMILLCLIPLFMYFIFNKKVIEKHNLESKRFNIYLSITWTGLSFSMIILTGKFISMLEDLGILHKCLGWECFLDGIEYLIFGIGMILQVVLVSGYKLCCYLYKKIVKK